MTEIVSSLSALSTKNLSQLWMERIEKLDVAFQPIVNIHTGLCYGYEIFQKNFEAAGFDSVQSCLDQAYTDEVLHLVELSLREKAIRKYVEMNPERTARLFFNLDGRLLESLEYLPEHNNRFLDQYSLSHDLLCFEVSEKQDKFIGEIIGLLGMYRLENFKIAIDDFGTGMSELQLFYHLLPDFIKLDRFYIRDIARDSKKKLLVSNVINMAHTLGMVTIAVGVENETEFYVCREIGFDLVQGFLIHPPTITPETLPFRFEKITALVGNDRRAYSSDEKLLLTELKTLPTISSTEEVYNIFDVFHKYPDQSFFPVVTPHQEPVGIIRESSIKEFTYHRFGRELLKNPSSQRKLVDFITPLPFTSVHTSVEKALEIFLQNENVEGIMIVDDMKYVGFLSAQSLLKVLNEKNLAFAREQNPLTKLPGNIAIHEYVSKGLDQPQEQYTFVYFDFDNFKPFNDKYGFRIGDRAILLFADLLKQQALVKDQFVGHIGGDDFFMGFHEIPLDIAKSVIQKLLAQFKTDVTSFYDPEAIEKGFIISKDREGNMKQFPLLSISAVVLEFPKGRAIYTTEQLSHILAAHKKASKMAKDGICVGDIHVR